MSDIALVREILRQLHWSAQTILKRFEPIRSPEDFLESDEGMEKLDAICMQLIAMGENVKNLDKVTDGELLQRYPNIEWKRIMGMRDILSHHYFDIDAGVVFGVCQNHMKSLEQTFSIMLDSTKG